MKRLSTYLLLSTLIVCLSFFLGVSLKTFEIVSWYDEFVHFAAGAWVAAVIIWISKKAKLPSFLKRMFENRFFLSVVILTLVVGLLWEVFEFGLSHRLVNIYNYYSGLQPSQIDTLSDLLMDILGAGAILLLLKKNK